jgi:hypothetical protein
VDQVQVQIVGAESLQRRLAGLEHRLVAEILREHLRGEKQLLAVVLGDDVTDLRLVHVPLGGVDVRVVVVECGPDGLADRLAFDRPRADADHRQFVATGQRYGWNCHTGPATGGPN